MSLSLSQFAPLLSVLTVFAGIVGAAVGVKYTAAAAAKSAEKTAEIVSNLATSVAVLQVQVQHLTNGLAAANEEMSRFRDRLHASLQ